MSADRLAKKTASTKPIFLMYVSLPFDVRQEILPLFVTNKTIFHYLSPWIKSRHHNTVFLKGTPTKIAIIPQDIGLIFIWIKTPKSSSISDE